VIAIIGSGTGTHKGGEPKVPVTKSSEQTPPVTPASHQSAVAGQPSVFAGISTQQNSVGTNGIFIKVSPLARRMAEEHGIDLFQVKGTGPGGRIVRDDIEDFIEQRAISPAAVPQPQSVQAVGAAPGIPEVPTADAEIVTLTSMQKTIARRLTESKQTVPHFYIGNEIDMTEVLKLRQELNVALTGEGIKISVNDLIVKACALALEKFPEVNGSYKDGQFVLHKRINIGIAVDVPSGLVVPVIRDANTKALRVIAREAKALAAKAQTGKLTSTELDGGTFSISNLGMMDVTDFVAVINPPQAAILAVAATRKTFVPIDDQPVIREIMHVTLSADHRILYGATVARFLKEVKHLLQNPFLLLV
ncbi:MAG TPA: dihydrolipoamide acetyltransferase family protein, partial [Ktedonobacteraceae bacterium]|nr:dihydrolipoamide acetyltransferase family protein [Ktedonobacteraceae bacterium]